MNIELIGDVAGTLGGVFFVICLVPEITLVIRNRSADDLSYSWLVLFLIGNLLSFSYLVIVDAIVGWVTLIPEFLSIALLIFLKYYYARNQDINKSPEETEVSLEEGSSSMEENKTTMDEDEGFTWSMDRTYRVPTHPGTSIHRGYHVILDYVFELQDGVSTADLSAFVFAVMQEACHLNELRIVHKHMEVFSEDQDETPPGFTSVCLIGESHVSAHCYSTLGMLAISIFTCGNIRNGECATEHIHLAMLDSTHFVQIAMRAVSANRFPSKFLATDAAQ